MGVVDRPNTSAAIRLNFVRVLVPGNSAWDHWAYWDWRQVLAGETPDQIACDYRREFMSMMTGSELSKALFIADCVESYEIQPIEPHTGQLKIRDGVIGTERTRWIKVKTWKPFEHQGEYQCIKE